MAELIAIREYARRKGCSDTAVRKAVAAGKIVKGIIRKEGERPLINPEIADKEWSTNFDPNYGGKARNPKLRATMLGEAEQSQPAEQEAQHHEPTTPPSGKRSLAELKRDTADVKLRISALDLKQKMGTLVDKDKVYKSLFSAGQEVRASFQSIPDRVIDEVLASPTRNEAHGILFNAIADALENLSEILNRELNV